MSSDRIIRFLESIGIAEPHAYDLDFASLSKDLFIPEQWNMVFLKKTAWDEHQLESFLNGIETLNYPIICQFVYEAGIQKTDVMRMVHFSYQRQFHQRFPFDLQINAKTIQLVVPFHESEHGSEVVESLQSFLNFLTYPFTVMMQLEAEKPTVDQKKLDALNQQAHQIAKAKLEEEHDDIHMQAHRERIVKAESQLLETYTYDVQTAIIKEKEKRKGLRGDYEVVALADITLQHEHVEVVGTIYSLFKREYDGKMRARFILGSQDQGIQVRMQEDKYVDRTAFTSLKDGKYVRIQAAVTADKMTRERTLFVHDVIVLTKEENVVDDAKEKRVELHLHTTMSTMDGIGKIFEYCKRAKAMGHEAIAITDHGVVQAFPEAQLAAQEYGLKMIYGAELYMIDTDVTHIMNPSSIHLDDAEYVFFDLETTGLSSRYDRMVEFGGVRYKHGQVVETLSMLIDPEEVAIQASASKVSGITQDMVKGQPTFQAVKDKIRTFLNGAILVSHNASFDIGFMVAAYERLGEPFAYPVIDTLTLSRALFTDARSHKLSALAKRLHVAYDEDQAHRAIYDAEVLQHVWEAIKDMLKDKGITSHDGIKGLHGQASLGVQVRPYHVTVLARNKAGLKALYELISLSHLHHFQDIPRVPRDELLARRQDLLIGSACLNGEVFEKARTQSLADLKTAIDMYDFIEIQPLDQYKSLWHLKTVESIEDVKKILTDIIQIAKSLDKMIVATGDVHYVDPDDKKIRDIYIAAKGLRGVQHPLNPYYRKDHPHFENADYHYRSTQDMLTALSWLEEADRETFVITNTRRIADMIEAIEPIDAHLKTPFIEGADESLRAMCFTKAKSIYGDELPDWIEERLTTELKGIIDSGYAVIYTITSQVIAEANRQGYIVGSRGSVGSSFAATMAGITEVNPLPPHYVCPTCRYVEKVSLEGIYSGFDLPEKLCPQCGHLLIGDGQDIPFATFLGFNADKVPDIDLNFPRDYQATAHAYTASLLKEDRVYRAGTIEKVAEKTAFGYVRGYFESINVNPDSISQATLTVLAKRAEGVRKTSGQHPGGIVIVPGKYDVHEFTPIQRPADNQDTDIITTHFDFDALHNTLLKFDMLGHIDPMALKMMADLTNLSLQDIPLNDPLALLVYADDAPLKRQHKWMQVANGALGLPEFGTVLGMDILNVIKPKRFSDLVLISGLAHGTDVFNGNARELIEQKTATLDEVIGCRDDIMTYLMKKGVDALVSFKIMEDVRKGKGLTNEFEQVMIEANVPQFYIQSCKKIQYLFPKAHAVAYVMMAVRVAYFKVYHPLAYYATYFTLRSKQYDYDWMLKPGDEIAKQLEAYKRLKNESRKKLSPKDADLEVMLANLLEMKERGFAFLPLDLQRSDATQFIIDEDRQGIIPPFIVLDGVGEAAAKSVIQARIERPFASIDDVKNRTKLSKTNIEAMRLRDVFVQLQHDEVTSLFSFTD